MIRLQLRPEEHQFAFRPVIGCFVFAAKPKSSSNFQPLAWLSILYQLTRLLQITREGNKVTHFEPHRLAQPSPP
jgi:hypothetical protein